MVANQCPHCKWTFPPTGVMPNNCPVCGRLLHTPGHLDSGPGAETQPGSGGDGTGGKLPLANLALAAIALVIALLIGLRMTELLGGGEAAQPQTVTHNEEKEAEKPAKSALQETEDTNRPETSTALAAGKDAEMPAEHRSRTKTNAVQIAAPDAAPEPQKQERPTEVVAPKPVEIAAPDQAPPSDLLRTGPHKPAPECGKPARVAPNTIALDDPAGQYTLPWVRGGRVVKLAGKIGTLNVTGADGLATVDASNLEAKRIFVTGPINGNSMVALNAPNGLVDLKKQVDGNSTLRIEAPDGKVVFDKGTNINGNSHVTITAREVGLPGYLDGRETLVEVTLTGGGELRYGDLKGYSRIHYKKAAAGDPDPVVEGGRIGRRAEVKRIQ